MSALARPAPETPLDSAIEASALVRLPPGKMDGERISIAGSRNRSAAASSACRAAPAPPSAAAAPP